MVNINGEAIYETRKSPVSKEKRTDHKVFFTNKNKELFCIFTKWTDSVEINLLNGENVKNVNFLGYDKTIKWKLIEPNKLIIEIPKLTIDEIPCLYAWTLKIELE